MLFVGVFVASGVGFKSVFRFHVKTCLSRNSFGGFWEIGKIALLKTVFVNIFVWFEASNQLLWSPMIKLKYV